MSLKQAFSGVMSATLIENGKWFTVEDPGTGEPLTLPGQAAPARIRVRSIASRAYRDYLTSQTRSNVSTLAATKNQNQARIKVANNAAREDRHEKVMVLITGLEHVTGPSVQVPSQEELFALVTDDKGALDSEMVWLCDWTIKKAEDDSEYGGEPGNGPRPSTGTQSESAS